jgi:hypothetical protein
MHERSKTDRRQCGVSPRFPMHDADNKLVKQDRRKLPDRRLSGIEVEWLAMVHQVGGSSNS